MANRGGYTGKILRVNLSDGTVRSEDTSRYLDYIGGMGLGYKVMWDEVPEGTKAFDPANKIVVGVGPLCGTGVPCSSRTNITSLLPSNPYNAITDSHMGGYFAVELKYAGWDGIIIEGKASYPVWLRIQDGDVSIENARYLWGKGTFQTIAEVSGMMGKSAQVAAIGQAGENLVNLAVIRTGSSHSAGGHGGVMGSKNLKAIGVIGTGSVKIAGAGPEWNKLDRFMMSIIGANNQHVVPSTPQPWAEYYDKGSRWTATQGLYWGAANPPVETGECDPHDIHSVGLRTQKGVKDLGPGAEKYTVRMGGCASCPVRCHSQLNVPQLEAYGFSPYVSNTCMGYSSPKGVMFNGFDESVEDNSIIGTALGAQLADDYGVWCNYGQIGRDLGYAYKKGYLKKVLPADEYASIPWDLVEKGDPAFLLDFYKRVTYRQGELSHIGDGAYWLAKRWGFGADYWSDAKMKLWSPLGYPVHHSNEANGQVGALISCMFNRDAQCHTHMNFIASGLPIELQKEIAGEIWGSPDALDAPLNYTPMNEAKAKFTKWSIVRNVLHDSLTVCNWMWPMTVSPLKERNYRGDTALESKFYTLATGVQKSEADLDTDGERIFTLHRAMTMKQMGTMDMRNKHDVMSPWVFDSDKDKAAFTAGTIKMDRADMEKAKGMLYEQMGWDKATGAPTRATLERLGMSEVAEELSKKGLLPA